MKERTNLSRLPQSEGNQHKDVAKDTEIASGENWPLDLKETRQCLVLIKTSFTHSKKF